ncbi:MAG: helix-turn-helix domain-containing protein [Vulcanimicrobiaceae bacterium]
MHEQQTAHDYLNRLRVSHACTRLNEANARLADVGIDCGFVDQSHFTRVFKSITGMTPAVFRNLIYQSRP